jgi:hypothetical protein
MDGANITSLSSWVGGTMRFIGENLRRGKGFIFLKKIPLSHGFFFFNL